MIAPPPGVGEAPVRSPGGAPRPHTGAMHADGLFVHGPLREGGGLHRWLQRTHPEGLCRAWVPGRLFHLAEAGLPALVPGPVPPALPPGPGWVAGDFVGYGDGGELETALADLDALATEAGGEARLLPVLLEGGAAYTAWAWVFPVEHLPRLEREALEVPEGDWAAWL